MHMCFKGKDKMRSILQAALDEARNNKLLEVNHRRLIDELIDLDLSDDVIMADMITMCIGGFHTTGLREQQLHCLLL